MIGPGVGARVMMATRPVDFRKGADSLAALVGVQYGGDPYSGVIYVFRAKRPQPPTFRIQFAYRDYRLSVAPADRENGAGVAVPAGQSPEVHLHPGAA